jgi:AcrR family transcriptional regulator
MKGNMSQALTKKKPSKRRTQAERSGESQRSLVKAAISVVKEEGVSAATFDNIAKRCNYSRGLVPLRFGSKQGLIEAVIGYLRDRPEASAVKRRINELSGLEALLAFVDIYLQQLSKKDDGQAYFRLLSAAVADISPLQSLFAKEHRFIRARIAQWVVRGQAEKTIRPEVDPSAAALMVGNLLLGVSIQILLDPAMDLGPIRRTCAASLQTAFGTK